MRFSASAVLTLIQHMVAKAAAWIRRRYDMVGSPRPGSGASGARAMLRKIARGPEGPCRFVNRAGVPVQRPERERPMGSGGSSGHTKAYRKDAATRGLISKKDRREGPGRALPY